MKRKICIVVGNVYSLGGEQKINIILANHLAENSDLEICIVSLFKTAKTPAFEISEKIEVVSLLDTGVFTLWKRLWFVLSKFKSFFAKRKFDTIISTLLYCPYISLSNPFPTKYVYWDHQGFFHGKFLGLEKLSRFIATYTSNSSTVVMSKYSQSIFKKISKKDKQIELIYNPISIFPTAPISYNKESKTIILCGRLIFRKGFDRALEVAKLVSKRHPDWKWELYGNGEMFDFLKAKAIQYGLEKTFILKGPTSDMDTVYRKGAMYVLTSRNEGFPLVLLEASAYGLPLVSFDCHTGPSEIINNGENGFLVKDSDIEQMADKVCSLIEDEKLRQKFSKYALSSTKDYSQEVFFKKWENLLRLNNND